MVDSGAQINLLSSTLAPYMAYEKLHAPYTRFKGVNGTTTCVSFWMKAQLTLENGSELLTTFAVVDDVPSTLLILGLPFLIASAATCNFKRLSFVNRDGFARLYQQPASTDLPLNYSISLPDDPSITEALQHVTDLTARGAVAELLYKYSTLWKDRKRGVVSTIKHEILLTTTRPIVSRPRVRTPEQDKTIDSEIQKMLTDDVIRPSLSPYASEIVMVLKKTGDWRMCIDFRPLNRATIDDKYPLPKLSEMIRSIKDSRYFIALDLRSGYWQIPMSESSIEYTAFRTATGLYEFKVMPFGLKNAPATFQRSMNFLLDDLRYSGVLVYLDDILIHSPDIPTLLKLTDKVFHRLLNAGYTINLQKCQFLPPTLLYLGHIIEDGIIRPNPKKVEAIQLLKSPSTSHEVRSLLGVTGFLQAFIPNYSQVTAPITDLLKGVPNKKTRVVKINWTTKCDDALTELKRLVIDSALVQPLDGDEFLLEVDACSYAIGGVLKLKRGGAWLPVHYVSRKLNATEQNWPIREKEAFAIIYCLQKLDYYVKSRHIVVVTDHQSLKWLMDAKSGKLARWAILLSEYDLDIQFRKGSENYVADYISRHVHDPDPVRDYMCYKVEVAEETGLHTTLATVLRAQDLTHLPNYRGLHIVDDVIYYRGGVYVPPELRTTIISECHLLPPFLHPGIKRTKSTILRVFNWPNLHQDVTAFVSNCLTCQRLRDLPFTKRSFTRHNPLEGAFAILHFDHWSCRFRGESFTVLTMIDPFTKWVEATVVADKTAITTASTLLCHWICRFGVPLRMVSDNALAFTGEVLEILADDLQCRHIHTVPYRPQGNSPVEAFHKNLNKSFKLYNLKNMSLTFEDALALTLLAYRSSVHSATGHSPAFLTFGRDPVSPYSQDFRLQGPNPSDRLAVLNAIRADILSNLKSLYNYSLSQARDLDRNVQLNDLVLVALNPRELYTDAVLTNNSEKLVPKWSLPFRVVNVSDNGFRITVRHLLSWNTKEVTRDQVKPISFPTDTRAREEWLQHLSTEMSTTEDPSANLKRFMSELQRPQVKLLRPTSPDSGEEAGVQMI